MNAVPPPPDWPPPDQDILHALQAAYRDGSWGKYNGPHIERLEARLAEFHDVGFALTCASGTFAVELALRALKIGPGDEVMLAAYDYPGNFLAIHAVGGQPVLVDIHPSNWNLDASGLAAAIRPATRALIVSHLHGGWVPMDEIMAFAAKHGLSVIEDAAQAPGAHVAGRRAGSWGDVGVLSFGGSKLLTAGRGGAILTRHADVYQRAKTWQFRGNLVSPLSELQAAVLLPQLDKLDARNVHRAANVCLLTKLLADVPGIRAFANPGTDDCPAYYKLGFQFDAAAFGMSREQFLAMVRAEGIALDAGFAALHVGRSPRRFRASGDLHEAEQAHRGTVMLHHPVLLEDSSAMERIARAIGAIQAQARE